MKAAVRKEPFNVAVGEAEAAAPEACQHFDKREEGYSQVVLHPKG